MPRASYVLRIKPGMVDKVPEALRAEELFIGWGDVPELLDPTWTGDDYARALSHHYYTDAPSMRQARSAARNTWHFIRDMRIGDIALVPHNKHFYVAEVLGPPTHRADFHGFSGFSRRARWLNDQRPFVKDELPEIKAALLDRPTIYPLNLKLRPAVAQFIDGLLPKATITEDIKILNERLDLSVTTRKALIDARVGQGRFRDELLSAWDHACAVTGCDVLSAVRASHAVPWRDSTDSERLDPSNGLPLLANLDALFDAGLIAFADSGEMLVSPQLPREHYGALGIPARLRRVPTPNQVVFLRRHRLNFKQ